jgi:hypothetical protein
LQSFDSTDNESENQDKLVMVGHAEYSNLGSRLRTTRLREDIPSPPIVDEAGLHPTTCVVAIEQLEAVLSQLGKLSEQLNSLGAGAAKEPVRTSGKPLAGAPPPQSSSLPSNHTPLQVAADREDLGLFKVCQNKNSRIWI